MPSGMSAIATAILVPKGGKILYSDPVYGGTYLFSVRSAIREHGPFDMIFLETPANPTMTMSDIAAIAEIAGNASRGKKPIIAVDNTLLGPVFQSPFLLGADIVAAGRERSQTKSPGLQTSTRRNRAPQTECASLGLGAARLRLYGVCINPFRSAPLF